MKAHQSTQVIHKRSQERKTEKKGNKNQPSLQGDSNQSIKSNMVREPPSMYILIHYKRYQRKKNFSA